MLHQTGRVALGRACSLKAAMTKYFLASVQALMGIQPTPPASALSDSTLYL